MKTRTRKIIAGALVASGGALASRKGMPKFKRAIAAAKKRREARKHFRSQDYLSRRAEEQAKRSHGTADKTKKQGPRRRPKRREVRMGAGPGGRGTYNKNLTARAGKGGVSIPAYGGEEHKAIRSAFPFKRGRDSKRIIVRRKKS